MRSDRKTEEHGRHGIARRGGSSRSALVRLVGRTVVVVLLSGAAALSAGGCSDPAADKYQARATAPRPGGPKPGSPDLAPSERVLPVVTAGSTIGFVGSKVTGYHQGEFRTFSGSVLLSADLKSVEAVTVRIDMTSTTTDNPKLTNHLLGPEFFDVARFPESTFVTTEVAPVDRAGSTHTLTGNLTLHGVTRSITFPAQVVLDGRSTSLAAEFAINRKDFGVNYAGQSDDLIRDEVVLQVSLFAPRAPS